MPPSKKNPKPLVSKARQKKPKSMGRPPRKPATKQEPVFQDDAPLTGTSPPSKKQFCGANLVAFNHITKKKNPKGATCKKAAGWGTDHPGWGHCRHHQGTTPTHSLNAAKQQVQDRMRTYGNPIITDPREGLLDEVARTAGHIAWLADIIAKKDESELIQFTLKEGMSISAWIAMYQEERKMFVNVCRVAISAGVAERRIRIAEDQGKMIATAMMSFINHPELNLTPQQLVDARPIIGEILRGLSAQSDATLALGGPNGPQPRSDDIVIQSEEIPA